MENGMAASAERGLSIQEQWYPTLPCFGWGHGNPKGLKLRSYAGDGVVTATFKAWPEHDNGFGYLNLNGGIICTVLDCHRAAAVTLEAGRRGWPPLPGAALPYVTAGFEVRYLRPSPLHEPVQLRAVVTEASESEISADVQLVWDGKTRATATARWKRWRPR
jgi:acyl-coenzyme A thioesterase PaaI-like protein